MPIIDTQYTLGAHAARIDEMDKRIREIQETQHKDAEKFNAKLDRIVSYIDRQRGGLWVASAIATFVGAAAAMVVEWLKK